MLGLKAYGTASSAKHEFIRKLRGILFDYNDRNWEKDFMEAEPEGVDAVLDAFGAASLKRS